MEWQCIDFDGTGQIFVLMCCQRTNSTGAACHLRHCRRGSQTCPGNTPSCGRWKEKCHAANSRHPPTKMHSF